MDSALRTKLDDLARALREAGGAAVEMVAVYGSAARGEHRAGVSDVNLMVVLGQADAPTLRTLAPVLGEARKDLRVAPFVLTRDELDRARDAFAAKLADIRLSYIVLAGENLLAHLDIQFEHLRLACERELRNISLRLRRAYLLGGTRPALRREALNKLMPNLYGTLRVLVAQDDRPTPMTLDELTAAVQARFGVDATVFGQANRLRHAPDDAAMAGVFETLAETIAQITRQVDEL